MDDDFSEFCSRVGTDVPIYRECQTCGDIVIVNPESYDKPKMECDPDQIDNCRYWMPICNCRNGRVLFTQEALDECTYPDCDCSSQPDE